MHPIIILEVLWTSPLPRKTHSTSWRSLRGEGGWVLKISSSPKQNTPAHLALFLANSHDILFAKTLNTPAHPALPLANHDQRSMTTRRAFVGAVDNDACFSTQEGATRRPPGKLESERKRSYLACCAVGQETLFLPKRTFRNNCFRTTMDTQTWSKCFPGIEKSPQDVE